MSAPFFPSLVSQPQPSASSVTVPKIEPEDDDFSDEEEGEFHIPGELSPPERRIVTLRELFDLIMQGSIDLNPPYQRDVVWPPAKQSLLIDSLWRNISIPALVFAIVPDEDGVPVKVCVDGKQRLTSIQKFLVGQLPYKMSRSKQYYFTSPDSAKQRLLIPDAYKEIFLDKQIACEEHSDLTPALEREIFQRVQMGMQLTAAEKLAAIDSPWSALVSVLEGRYVTSDNGLADLLDWDTKRGRQFQNIAQLVYCAEQYPSEEVPTAAKITKWISRTDAPSPEFRSDIKSVLDDYTRIAEEPHLKSVAFSNKQRISPIEFVFIGVLLYVIRRFADREKAACIQFLRKTIRKRFTDIRMNSNVGLGMWAIIDELKHDPPTHSSSSRKKRGAESDHDYRPGMDNGSKRRRG
ncbi:hypothetical protein MIND_00739600 [Mycena indigotica]|uniref:GmrSD restriction endonucleases N-terminal domain-containing protein n=1 Tax=Mycena indigotica TaxID=2126181 RepID=A0A8H6SMT3_9AGAR|nr:uncharacterized protein MIND_00739600 [Mycena indigotica]KAF7301740.1 hypothetical protein MIND_00739600 [Mycena indigotica]